jgi:toxin YoeB
VSVGPTPSLAIECPAAFDDSTASSRTLARNPFKGIGKPELLKGDLAGWWSRRITGEHRLVYRVSGKAASQPLEIVSCRYYRRSCYVPSLGL